MKKEKLQQILQNAPHNFVGGVVNGGRFIYHKLGQGRDFHDQIVDCFVDLKKISEEALEIINPKDRESYILAQFEGVKQKINEFCSQECPKEEKEKNIRDNMENSWSDVETRPKAFRETDFEDYIKYRLEVLEELFNKDKTREREDFDRGIERYTNYLKENGILDHQNTLGENIIEFLGKMSDRIHGLGN